MKKRGILIVFGILTAPIAFSSIGMRELHQELVQIRDEGKLKKAQFSFDCKYWIDSFDSFVEFYSENIHLWFSREAQKGKIYFRHNGKSPGLYKHGTGFVSVSDSGATWVSNEWIVVKSSDLHVVSLKSSDYLEFAKKIVLPIFQETCAAQEEPSEKCAGIKSRLDAGDISDFDNPTMKMAYAMTTVQTTLKSGWIVNLGRTSAEPFLFKIIPDSTGTTFSGISCDSTGACMLSQKGLADRIPAREQQDFLIQNKIFEKTDLDALKQFCAQSDSQSHVFDNLAEFSQDCVGQIEQTTAEQISTIKLDIAKVCQILNTKWAPTFDQLGTE